MVYSSILNSAFPATGAFSRTAIMARSGVKTPIAGVFSGAVVVLALYALTPAFYYIPDAILSAVVIHAVSDLVSGPKYIKEVWTASPFEFLVWLSAVLVTFFVDVETGIYVAVGLSLAHILLRLARPDVQSLGRLDPMSKQNNSYTDVYVDERDPNFVTRLQPLPRGVVLVRPCDSILYPNAGHMAEAILNAVRAHTRQGGATLSDKQKVADRDRPWNEEPPTTDFDPRRPQLPRLRALILDMRSVRRLDSTALQMLVNLRETLNKYAADEVEWRFACLYPNVRNDLLHFGFGSIPRHPLHASDLSDSRVSSPSLSPPSRPRVVEKKSSSSLKTCKPAPSSGALSGDLEIGQAPALSPQASHPSSLAGDASYQSYPYAVEADYLAVHPLVPRDKHPAFHWDIDDAVRSTRLSLELGMQGDEPRV